MYGCVKNKSLVKLGTQQALFPIVPDNAADRLGHALLDGKCHASAVINKLAVEARIVLGRRREAGVRAGRALTLPPVRRVHDYRLGEVIRRPSAYRERRRYL